MKSRLSQDVGRYNIPFFPNIIPPALCEIFKCGLRIASAGHDTSTQGSIKPGGGKELVEIRGSISSALLMASCNEMSHAYKQEAAAAAAVFLLWHAMPGRPDGQLISRDLEQAAGSVVDDDAVEANLSMPIYLRSEREKAFSAGRIAACQKDALSKMTQISTQMRAYVHSMSCPRSLAPSANIEN